MKISIWILGDQLIKNHPAIQAAQNLTDNNQVQVVFIESHTALQKRLYHKRKLVLLLSAMRHYANELREAGLQVDYRKAHTFEEGLQAHLGQFPSDKMITMGASSYYGRRFQHTLKDKLKVAVEILPNTQFLVGQYDPFPDVSREKKVLLENFY